MSPTSYLAALPRVSMIEECSNRLRVSTAGPAVPAPVTERAPRRASDDAAREESRGALGRRRSAAAPRTTPSSDRAAAWASSSSSSRPLVLRWPDEPAGPRAAARVQSPARRTATAGSTRSQRSGPARDGRESHRRALADRRASRPRRAARPRATSIRSRTSRCASTRCTSLELREARRPRLVPRRAHPALPAPAPRARSGRPPRDPVRWLLADEVGLGKTVEACLVLSRLAAHRAGRALPRGRPRDADRAVARRAVAQVPPGLRAARRRAPRRRGARLRPRLQPVRRAPPRRDRARDAGRAARAHGARRPGRDRPAGRRRGAPPAAARRAIPATRRGARSRRSPPSAGTCCCSPRSRSTTTSTASSACCSCCAPPTSPKARASRPGSRAPSRCPPAPARRGASTSAGCRRAWASPSRATRPRWRARLALVEAVRAGPGPHALGTAAEGRARAPRARLGRRRSPALLGRDDAALGALRGAGRRGRSRASPGSPRRRAGWRAAGDKTLVFVAHRETLEWLRTALSRRAQLATGVFHEGLSPARRDIEVAQFRLAPRARACSSRPSAAARAATSSSAGASCSSTCPGTRSSSSSASAASTASAAALPVEIVYFLPPEGIGRDVARLFEALGLFREPLAGLEPELARVEAALELAALSPVGIALRPSASTRSSPAPAPPSRASARRPSASCTASPTGPRWPRRSSRASRPTSTRSTRTWSRPPASGCCLHVEPHAGHVFSIELGNEALVDSLPGVPGGLELPRHLRSRGGGRRRAARLLRRRPPARRGRPRPPRGVAASAASPSCASRSATRHGARPARALQGRARRSRPSPSTPAGRLRPEWARGPAASGPCARAASRRRVTARSGLAGGHPPTRRGARPRAPPGRAGRARRPRPVDAAGYLPAIDSSSTSKTSVEFGGICPLARAAVGERGRDRQAALAADLHARRCPAPSPAMTCPAPRRKAVRRFRVVRAVELGSVRERADVVHRDRVAGDGRGAGADDEVLDDERCRPSRPTCRCLHRRRRPGSQGRRESANASRSVLHAGKH